MLIGIHLLYKILKEKEAKALLKVKPQWLDPTELKFYEKIQGYLRKYGKLPPPPKKEPTDYEDHPIEYYLEALYNRYLVQMFEGISEILEGTDEEKAQRTLKTLMRRLLPLYMESFSLQKGILTSDDLKNYVSDMINELRISNLDTLLGIPTGYPTLDSCTGGYYKSDVFAWVGRPKTGKTTYLLHSINSVIEQDKKVLFISMEMTESEIMTRLLAIRRHIPISYFLHGRISSFAEEEILTEVDQIKEKLIFIRGSEINSVTDIAALIEGYEPDLIAIDGAYLLPSKKTYKAEWERAKAIIEDIKRIALRFSLPFVCTYQLNREAARAKQIDTIHISFTDAIAQIATAIVTIKNDPDQETKKIMMILANRRGVDQVEFPVHWDWLQSNFSEVRMGGEEDADNPGTPPDSDEIL